MKAVVVYESMYGNTHAIAGAIAAGLTGFDQVEVLAVGEVDAGAAAADLLVVGGPTHVHGLSRASTRQSALDATRGPGAVLTADPHAAGPGLREWLASAGRLECAAAAFDTRLRAPAMLTGQASHALGRLLRRHGATLLAEESFLVDRETHLTPGETERAQRWGRQLAELWAARASAPQR